MIGPIRGTRLPAEIKRFIVGAVTDAKQGGATITRSCEILMIDARRVRRWIQGKEADRGDGGPGDGQHLVECGGEVNMSSLARVALESTREPKGAMRARPACQRWTFRVLWLHLSSYSFTRASLPESAKNYPQKPEESPKELAPTAGQAGRRRVCLDLVCQKGNHPRGLSSNLAGGSPESCQGHVRA